MANNKDLYRLQQGVGVWNDWREQYPEHRVNLWGADLSGASLSNVKLEGALLCGANLQKTDFWNADLRGANLEGANLSNACLRSPKILSSSFGLPSPPTTLIRANLEGANLEGANLEGADLRAATLIRAHLCGADLRWADLSGAKLRGADLRMAKLEGADLREANLEGADLSGANLEGADLREANLRDTDLRRSTLINSRLAGANLTGAKLWESQRASWSIKGVICQRAFWDKDGKEPTDYGDGDFERVFAEKPRIVLRYPDSMSAVDLAMLPLIVERLEAKHPGCALHIHSVEDAGAGAVVTITVDDLVGRDAETFMGEIETLRCSLMAFQQQLRYEERLRLQFEARYTALVTDIVPMLLDRIPLRQEINVGQLKGPIIEEIRMSNVNVIHGQGVIGDVHRADDMTFHQVWRQSGFDLPKLAEELGRLRAAMKQETQGTSEHKEALDAVAAAETAAMQDDKPAVLRHLTIAGKWALGIAEKIGVPFAVDVLKGVLMQR